MQPSFKLNHRFTRVPDSRNFIYDCLTNKVVPNQPTVPIANSLHLVKDVSTPTTLVVPGCGVLNQGNLGSCAANALAVAISIASQGTINDSCRLYTYFVTECLEGANPLQDNGSTTPALAQSLKTHLCCSEKYFSYSPQNYLKIPPLVCFQNTYPLKSVVYSYIAQDANLWSNIQNAVLNNIHNTSGHITGMTVGFQVYSSFMSSSVASSGIIPMPNTSKEKLLGGHCVAIIGYTVLSGTNYVVFQNSWGTTWGNKGCGYLPVTYLQNNGLCEQPLVISLGR